MKELKARLNKEMAEIPSEIYISGMLGQVGSTYLLSPSFWRPKTIAMYLLTNQRSKLLFI